ncbi:hypothetical protein GCM10023063_46870 [Arthrobacter methylotrophus]|uniref:Response regulator transcription factor n=1 Tax=Arthrobacter methylotrophus TaxID=121291 RepID=A0ABV5UVI9_9MICC
MINILIVEDDPNARMGLVMGLRHHDGYQVQAVPTGEAALEMLRAQGEDVDLLILDYMLPGIDGIETCSHIRQFSKVPIIFLSASGEDDTVISALERGADDYLVKPVRIVTERAQGRFRHNQC